MQKGDTIVTKYPYETDSTRIHDYEVNQNLLEAKHFEAFSIEGESSFSQRYNKLRYVVANLNGLVAKVSADMLFGEDVTFKANNNQEFIDALIYANKLDVQLWESAVTNSACGDAVFKIRVEDNEIKIEDVDPSIYFPSYNTKNPRQEPDEQELAWIEIHNTENGEKRFLVREIHTAGRVEIKIFTMNGDIIGDEIDVNGYNTTYGTNYIQFVDTNIDKPLLVHIKNMSYRGNRDFFGDSDFVDMNTLQFELNNRLTKTANILDKHSDPILAVPDGVLDEQGNVKKEALQMVELGEDGEVPQYIVWNASLDNAFKEIDKITEYLFMVSEISPDVLGMGKGSVESGRALKMRLIRTISKITRKQRYYTQGLQEVFEICQKLSVNNKGVGVTYMGKRVTSSGVELVSIQFSDGVVNDTIEELDAVVKRLDAGIMSKKSAIMLLDGTNEEETLVELNDIKEDKATFTSILDTLGSSSDEKSSRIFNSREE